MDYVFSDPEVQSATAPERSAVASMLASVGFTPQLLDAAVGSLSGGWKMKLALGGLGLVFMFHCLCGSTLC